jgi:hypothetical protein
LGREQSRMLFCPLDFELGFWRLHTMAIQVERPWEFMPRGFDFGLGLWKLYNTMPSRRLQFLDFIGYLFAAHFFRFSTKLGLSILHPLDFDGHSVKRP